jgi:hypothetical protein
MSEKKKVLARKQNKVNTVVTNDGMVYAGRTNDSSESGRRREDYSGHSNECTNMGNDDI